MNEVEFGMRELRLEGPDDGSFLKANPDALAFWPITSRTCHAQHLPDSGPHNNTPSFSHQQQRKSRQTTALRAAPGLRPLFHVYLQGYCPLSLSESIDRSRLRLHVQNHKNWGLVKCPCTKYAHKQIFLLQK